MKFMVTFTLPNEPFNTAVRDGSAGEKLQRILDDIKPDAVYFTDNQGCRSAILIVEMADSSRIPAITEPWFMTFNASVHCHPVMLPEDLARSGLDELGKKWG